MLVFTDDDLRDLKERLAKWPNIDVCNYFDDDTYILALIARLEAAEKALRSANEWIRGGVAGGDVTYAFFDENYETWRKVAGK